MLDTIHVLGIPITYTTQKKAKSTVLKWLDGKDTKLVFTPNPEIVMAALKDDELKTAIESADMVTPDGIGVVWASRYSEKRLKQRVAGYDLVQAIFNDIAKTDKKVYFLGGAPKVAAKAAKKMKQKYTGLKIVGTHDGYFDKQEELHIIEQINKLEPDLLLVGLGFPKQEKWLYNNRNKLKSKVCIGVGGSFDVMAGKLKRAPTIFQKLGIEWLYRLITQPTRIMRMMQLPIFAIKVVISNQKGVE